MRQVLFIIIGAGCGALFRWFLGLKYNPVYPSLPLGTLLANLSGCFIMGSIMLLSIEHNIFRKDLLIGITTGFLSSLTTYSTLSAEVLYLITRKEYGMGILLIGLHLFGSLIMVSAGFFSTKALIQLGIK